jgi:hypothetical protein
MRSVLALFGLLSALMLVFSLPLENSVALEKRQNTPALDPTAIITQVMGLLDELSSMISGATSGGSSSGSSGSPKNKTRHPFFFFFFFFFFLNYNTTLFSSFKSHKPIKNV